MNAAIGKEIATKNIVVILWSNGFPVVFIGNNLVLGKVLKKLVSFAGTHNNGLFLNNSFAHMFSKV
jgi:hypothetical protein